MMDKYLVALKVYLQAKVMATQLDYSLVDEMVNLLVDMSVEYLVIMLVDMKVDLSVDRRVESKGHRQVDLMEVYQGAYLVVKQGVYLVDGLVEYLDVWRVDMTDLQMVLNQVDLWVAEQDKQMVAQWVVLMVALKASMKDVCLVEQTADSMVGQTVISMVAHQACKLDNLLAVVKDGYWGYMLVALKVRVMVDQMVDQMEVLMVEMQADQRVLRRVAWLAQCWVDLMEWQSVVEMVDEQDLRMVEDWVEMMAEWMVEMMLDKKVPCLAYLTGDWMVYSSTEYLDVKMVVMMVILLVVNSASQKADQMVVLMVYSLDGLRIVEQALLMVDQRVFLKERKQVVRSVGYLLGLVQAVMMVHYTVEKMAELSIDQLDDMMVVKMVEMLIANLG